MPVRRLPSNPNLDHLKYQAKDLLEGHAQRNQAVAQRVREFHPRFHGATDAAIFDSPLNLSSAQLAIAREYGFPSWSGLKTHLEKSTRVSHDLPHHERITDSIFRRGVDLLDAGDAAGLRDYLKQHPQLVRQHVTFEGENYFRNPTMLEFVAENPVRQGRLPENIVEVATVILDAGAERSAVSETLGLVCSGRVARECGVQFPLIDLLCNRGADPDCALLTAAGHGEFAAVEALLARGASLTLPIAAALNRVDVFRRLLPDANSADLHLALALAAQFGRLEIVRSLLDAGEDPDRYNPAGSHSHSTPLHQAAFAGHDGLVRLLIERGARTDMKDILWQGTPADWAAYAGRKEIAQYLRACERTKRSESLSG
jgi:hypothetical protein